MDGVDQAGEVVEVDQPPAMMQLGLWEEAEGERQRSAVWHARGRPLEKYRGKTVEELDSAVVEGPPMPFFLLETVVAHQILVLPLRRLLSESLGVWEVEVGRGLQRLRRLDAALEGSELALGRTCQHRQMAAAP